MSRKKPSASRAIFSGKRHVVSLAELSFHWFPTPTAKRRVGKIKFTRPSVSTRARTVVESAMMPG
jgi:hypothetical protein